MFVSTLTRRTRRVALTGLALLASVGVTACSSDAPTAAERPTLPGTPEPVPGIRKASFVVDVDTRTRQVRITPASQGIASAGSSGALGTSGIRGDISSGPRVPGAIRGSILAGDVVLLMSSNYRASAVGQFQPGKVRVSVDINITNRLAGVELITPTFPTPPAGTVGILLFPFETSVTVTSGGTSVGGDGTDVIFEQPSYGQVESSIDWDGAPHNFFNDVACAAGSNDCFRNETFNPLAAGSTSEARTVGFDIDPTVGTFRARLIVAADLRNSGPAPVGSVAGSVTSPQRGALPGVTVNVSGGFSGLTAASGAYSVAGVNTGPRTISLAAATLPAGCTVPASQSITVTAGVAAPVSFTVTCTVPSGAIAGSLLSSLGGGASGTQVFVTPAGGSEAGPFVAAASGAFTTGNTIPVAGGAGSVRFANLPAGCSNPGAQPYGGLTENGSVSLNVTFVCVAPAAFHTYTASWSAVTAGQVTLTVRFNPTTRNDPAINGAAADDFTGISGNIGYPTTRLTFVSAANGAGSPFAGLTVNSATAGQLNWLNFTTATPPVTEQVVATFTFSVTGTGPVSVTQSLSEVVSDLGTLYNLTFIQIVNPALVP